MFINDPSCAPPNSQVALTSLVAREDELRAVFRLVGHHSIRLLTITGAGGVGKTRLVIATLNQLNDLFESSYFVSLASIFDPGLVLPRIASEVGVVDVSEHALSNRIENTLRGRRVLLVLDNFEHLISSAPLVVSLLAGCPQLTVIVTSRSRLRVRGEHEFEVNPLAVPDSAQIDDFERLGQVPAVMLFLERARAVNHHFNLTVENAQAITHITQRLDGLPLALELAAARLNMLSPRALLDRLNEGLGVLAAGARDDPDRLRTMRSAIAWSYELLSPNEKTLFRTLGVFVGGWTIDSAEAVSCNRDGTFEDLAILVDHHLVRPIEQLDGSVRFHMLTMIREFALEQLRKGDDWCVVRRRHASHFLSFAEETTRALSGPEQFAGMRQFDGDLDNIRAALSWSIEFDEIDVGLRLANALTWFWYTTGQHDEGLQWFGRMLANCEGTCCQLRATALGNAGWLSLSKGDFLNASKMLCRATRLHRSLGDVDGLAYSLANLVIAVTFGQLSSIQVTPLLDEALRLRPQLQSARTVGNIVYAAGLHKLVDGDPCAAMDEFKEALEVYRRAGDLTAGLWAMTSIGLTSVGLADYKRGSVLLSEAMEVSKLIGDKNAVLHSVYGLACVAAGNDEPLRAARLWGFEEAMKKATGLTIATFTRSFTKYDQHLAIVRDQIGEQAFSDASAEGHSMSEQDAIAYALKIGCSEIEQPCSDPVRPITSTDRLTGREIQVLHLLASGKSNKEISFQLNLSLRTVERHIANIYHKLEVHNRAEATSFAYRHKLISL